MNDPPRLFVGVDWATEEHQVCVLRPGGEIVLERAFTHSGDGLAELVSALERLSGGHLEEVQVAIEMPHGAVVETLLERRCQVFSINPKQLDRFRDRYSLPGAKDDRRDALVLADSLRTDPHCFRRLRIDRPLVLELREWSRMHEELKREKVRQAHRVREQLRRYFPQYLELTGDVSERWFIELWEQVRTPQAAQKVSPAQVAEVLKRHRIRRLTPSHVLQTLRKRPVVVAPGTVEAACAHIHLVLARLALVNDQIRHCEKRLGALLEGLALSSEEEESEQREQRDLEILLSIPGVGRITAATLLAEAAQALRQREYHTLRSLAGVAPVTLRSGKSWRVVMRYACHSRLRNACYHWARVAMQHERASGELYRRLRQRGKTHGRALRAVADRLLRVACSMLRHGTLYDPRRCGAGVV